MSDKRRRLWRVGASGAFGLGFVRTHWKRWTSLSFEGDYPGDPGFVYTVAAYKRIGAHAAYEALQAAFRQFPGGALPLSIDERLRVFESMSKATWDQIERRYYDADKETERCLAGFIRENRREYERLRFGYVYSRGLHGETSFITTASLT